MPKVVVGVDASKYSLSTLRWAAQEPRWRNATLEVVHAFRPPEPIAAFPVLPARGRDRIDVDEMRRELEERLTRWLEESDVDLSGIEVVPIVADGRAARALVDRSADAELLVVGSRGRGGFAGLRLGAVTEQVARHARCAVLVARDNTKG